MHYKVKRTRARIIKSALAVFAAYGKTGARMNEIANLAGVNKAALNYHFFIDLNQGIIHIRKLY